MIKAIVIQARECGLEVFRLLVWRDDKLVMLKTHMSQAAALTQLIQVRHSPEKFASLQASEVK